MKIWDLPTRLYHWLQAGLFMALIVTGYNGEGPHVQLGLGLLTLLIWRLIWGVIGSDTSRFRQFICSPSVLLQYLRGLFLRGPFLQEQDIQEQDVRDHCIRGKKIVNAGHNPAGGWMVISLLLCLLLQCISGLVIAGFADNLPSAEFWLTDEFYDIFYLIHNVLFYVLPALVSIHVAAIIGYKLANKPLVLAMITGYQAKSVGVSMKVPLYFGSNLKALLVLIAAVLVTMAIVMRS